jgi:hypothetical protein
VRASSVQWGGRGERAQEHRDRRGSAIQEGPNVKISLLVRFVAVAEELHFPRAAKALGIPLASLYSSISKLEDEVGAPLFVRDATGTRLTPAGTLLLVTARDEIAVAPAPPQKPIVPAGGKAKASKGKGRAPAVKGQPKPFKKRQGR